MKKMNVLNDFSNMLISVLTHDLRQPFASFITTIDTIKYTRRALSQEDLYIMLEDIRAITSESVELLDGLLCWTMSKKPGFNCETRPLLLNDLIHEANSPFLLDQLNKNISLYNVISQRQLIYANKSMLQFINRSILSHVTKYSSQSSILAVACSIDENWITVSFISQGLGMTAKQLEELFNINEAVSPMDGQPKGNGIALNICRDMMQQMNGKLWVESIPDNGTTFFYSVPLIKQLF
jgi:K+-sensing histidine kinase KdpD